ncbi:ras-related protein Rab-20 [Patella vulgata]|uniref:ras-related protein Rab-20 n=1 Tax=Patella vulgata TaxID=6465 RepID=UPI0021800842|nr:ras-related protein Rab-20 [Patella vulgata]
MSGKRKPDLKVIIMGDFAVGKSSLVCRYIEDVFKKHDTTIGAAFFLKQWGPYNVAVWDTAGDERYTGLSQFYCRNAGAVILAYDVTNPQSYESLWARFLPLVESSTEKCLKVVVGTKIDLLENGKRDITIEEGRKLAQELNEGLDLSKVEGDPYFETSSKNGTNVQEVFEYMFQYCLPLTGQKSTVRKDIVDLYETDTNSPRAKKACC